MKLTVKPVPNLLFPELLCCYQEKAYGTAQQIPCILKLEL